MSQFVSETSIVRSIWGKADVILFIFGGAAAEFALNKAVDWLYFTGKLPDNPIDRLFSTVVYAHKILFEEEKKAINAIHSITHIHQNVEAARGHAIPDWAYRDVLYMLIHYSAAAFELLERKLTYEEKQEIFNVFYRVGKEMKLTGLPDNYEDWLITRNEHLEHHLAYSKLSEDLFKRYRLQLGPFRYYVLLQVQKLLVPQRVFTLLGFSRSIYFPPVLNLYKSIKRLPFLKEIKFWLLPAQYRQTLKQLEQR